MSNDLKIDDGGPAFPQTRDNGPEDGFAYARKGISVRDFFAAQALAGLLVTWKPHVTDLATAEKGAAIAAYRIADAMLAERKQGGAS